MSNYPDNFRGLPSESFTDLQESAMEKLDRVKTFKEQAVKDALTAIMKAAILNGFHLDIPKNNEHNLADEIESSVEDFIFEVEDNLEKEAGL